MAAGSAMTNGGASTKDNRPNAGESRPLMIRLPRTREGTARGGATRGRAARGKEWCGEAESSAARVRAASGKNGVGKEHGDYLSLFLGGDKSFLAIKAKQGNYCRAVHY